MAEENIIAIVTSAASAGAFASEMLKDLVKDLFKENIKSISKIDLVKKFRRKYFKKEPNDFADLYSQALIELWHENENENLIALFKEPEVVSSIYRYKYDTIETGLPDALKDVINQKFGSLLIGDNLLSAGIKPEEAWHKFSNAFDRLIHHSVPMSMLELSKKIDNISTLQEVAQREQKRRNDQLLKKFEDDAEFVDESDIIKALCTDEAVLKRYGTWFALRLNYLGAAPLIKENLASSDPLLLAFTIEAVCKFQLQECSAQVIQLFTHKDETVSGYAKFYYFIYLKDLKQDNLPLWLEWLHQSNQDIKSSVLSEFATFVGKGLLDVASIQGDLLHERPKAPAPVREFIYRLLQYSLKPPSIHDLTLWLDEEENEINILCICRLLFQQNQDELVGRFLLEKLNNNNVDDVRWHRIALLCRSSENELCKRAFDEASERPNGEFIDLYYYQEQVVKISLKPNAISKGRPDLENKLLKNDTSLQEFMSFVERCKKGAFSKKRMVCLLVVDPENSIFTINGVQKFLRDSHFYHHIDYTNKNHIQSNRLVAEYSKSENICITLPTDIPPYLENLLREIYDYDQVTTEDINGKETTVKFNERSSVLLLVSEITYKACRRENFFDRLIYLEYHISHSNESSGDN